MKTWPSVLVESLSASFGLTLGGLISIQVAAYFNGVDITFKQAIGMNAFFFCTRLLWLIPNRYAFKRWGGNIFKQWGKA